MGKRPAKRAVDDAGTLDRAHWPNEAYLSSDRLRIRPGCCGAQPLQYYLAHPRVSFGSSPAVPAPSSTRQVKPYKRTLTLRTARLSLVHKLRLLEKSEPQPMGPAASL